MNRHAMELHQRFTPSCGGQPPGDLREVLASYKEMAQGDAELLAALVLGDRDTPGALKEYLDFHAYRGAKAGEIVPMVGGPVKEILPHVPDTLLSRMAAASVASVRGLGDEAEHTAARIGVLLSEVEAVLDGLASENQQEQRQALQIAKERGLLT